MVADDFVRKYKLPVVKAESPDSIRGVNRVPFVAKYECVLKVRSRVNGFELVMVAEVVPASALAYSVQQTVITDLFRKFIEVPLADTAFYEPRLHIPRVEILLGAEYYEAVLLNMTRNYKDLILRNTQFGWTITGPMQTWESKESVSQSKFCNLTVQCVQEQLAQFMKLEEPTKSKVAFWQAPRIADPEAIMDVESTTRMICPEGMDQAKYCVQHFEATHIRTNEYFQVSYPYVLDQDEALICNRREAVGNLLHTEKKRKSIEPEYNEFMEEYQQLDHMIEVLDPRKKPAGYFIPHQAVIRPSSTTTSTRVVFNASSRTKSGYSLNDVLATGPSIQPDLFDILVKFRTFRFAFCADITKMYRCVWLDPKDRTFQHILWRCNEAESIREFELNTITYGTVPASFMATMCLEMLAREVETASPKVADAI